MINLSQYGFKSRAAFVRTQNVDPAVFLAMASDPDWQIAKNVLYHPECPVALRDQFANDPIWYKRLVAYFTQAAPKEYFHKAKVDPDQRVTKNYWRTLDWRNAPN